MNDPAPNDQAHDDLDPIEGIVAEHAPDAEEGKGPSIATQLVQLARKRYQVGQDLDGGTFAVPKTGPALVRALRGGRASLRAELAREFYEQKGKAAPQASLADAMTVLEGYAATLDPTPLALRVARHGPQRVLDLGDSTGRAVVIGPGSWHVADASPVLFRRTELTGVLPEPERGGSLDELWRLVNVRPKYRPVLAAFLVAALTPDIPHPVAALDGEQGSGKSTATKMIASVVDPSPAQLRKPPRDLETWTTAAAGSHVVALDNLSSIPAAISDALCRASTGDGDVRRRLYSDGDLHVISFRRVVIFNGIDLGVLADDLADRLVSIHLDRIRTDGYLRDSDVAEAWTRAHPRVLGALLDLAAQVLAVMDDVVIEQLPRMADFGLILAAVDHLLGTDGLEVYRGLRDELAEDVVATDPALGELVRKLETFGPGPRTWTARELLDQIESSRDDRAEGFPRDVKAMAALLARRAPTLRRLGWTVEKLPTLHPRTRAKQWSLTPPTRPTDDDEPAVDPSDGGSHVRGPGNDTRSTRTTRSGSVVAGQAPCTGASGAASDRRAGTRSEAGSLAVSNANCEYGEHGASASTPGARASLAGAQAPDQRKRGDCERASDASTDSGSSHMPSPREVWRRSGTDVRVPPEARG